MKKYKRVGWVPVEKLNGIVQIHRAGSKINLVKEWIGGTEWFKIVPVYVEVK